MTNPFAEFAKKTLIENLGVSGKDLFMKVNSRKPIEEIYDNDEILNIIKTMENIIIAINGKETSEEIGLILRNKIIELEKFDTERKKENLLIKEVEEFFSKNEFPSETEIRYHAKYLALKNGININEIQNKITDHAKTHVKKIISAKRIKVEICGFLDRFPQPEKRDIIDFVNYIRLSRIIYPETQLKEDIEEERILRKFYRVQELGEPSLIDQFMSFVRENRDREVIKKYMEKEGNIYLIKEKENVSETLLSELIDMIVISENGIKEVLAQMGLQHMIENN